MDVTSSQSDQSLRRCGQRRRYRRARNLVTHCCARRRRAIRLQHCDHAPGSAKSAAAPTTRQQPAPAATAATRVPAAATAVQADGRRYAGPRPAWRGAAAGTASSEIPGAARAARGAVATEVRRASSPATDGDPTPDRPDRRKRLRAGDVHLWHAGSGGARTPVRIGRLRPGRAHSGLRDTELRIRVQRLHAGVRFRLTSRQ